MSDEEMERELDVVWENAAGLPMRERWRLYNAKCVDLVGRDLRALSDFHSGMAARLSRRSLLGENKAHG